MKRILIIISALFLLANIDVKAQGCAADTIYYVSNGELVEFTETEKASGYQLSCEVPSLQLRAHVFAPGDPAQGYAYEKIPYNPPFAFNSGTEVILAKDDCWGKKFSFGFGRIEPPGVPSFNFNFYGINYNAASANSNGGLKFIKTAADEMAYCTPESASTNTAGDWTYCSYELGANSAIPNTNSNDTMLLNSVLTPFHDIHFSTNAQMSCSSFPGHMYFQVIGDYPCRKIVLSYYQVPLYNASSHCFEAGTVTHMAVLYETTNVIEFYMKDKRKEPNWQGGKAILGIQNADGTQATVITNDDYGTSHTSQSYNNTEWEATNEAWRIRPVGQLDSQVEWFKVLVSNPTDTIGPLPATNEGDVIAQPSYDDGPTWYIARAEIWRLDDLSFYVYDSVLIKPFDVRPTVISHNSATNNLTVENNEDSLAYRDVVCRGDNVVFRLKGGDEYSIVSPSVYANNQIVDSVVVLRNIPTEDSVKYVFEIRNNDANGNLICTRYDSCVIYNNSFEIDLGENTTICKNESVTYKNIAELNEEEGPYTYLWSTGATDEELTYFPPSTEVLSCTATNVYGCTATNQATITVNQAPEVEILGNVNICAGTSTTLSAQSSLGNCIYEWSSGQTTANITVSPTETTEYTVSVKFPPAMCETIVSKTVNVKEAPIIHCNEDQNICYGETATVMVTTEEQETLRYEWQSVDPAVNSSTATNFVVAPQGTTHYTVTAYNDFNCHSTDEVIVYVEQKPIPIITFAPKAVDALDPIVVFTDSTVGAISTLWELSDGTSSTEKVFVHTFDLEDSILSYNVTLTSETQFGCVDSVSALIRVKRQHHLWAPTGVYLHDNNPTNRTFKLHIDNLSEYNLKIFNRWGTLMFETNDIEQAWDCTYKDKPVQQGVYVWKVTYRHNDTPNREFTDSGNFMIYY
ncbi:MAG: gliding motility-associated C-terminal domain-containing protein [Bacteroidales bacterium]|nr:gliding motility-associated C-terminal domain-containing protein [Bacteroidales bacterium]